MAKKAPAESDDISDRPAVLLGPDYPKWIQAPGGVLVQVGSAEDEARWLAAEDPDPPKRKSG